MWAEGESRRRLSRQPGWGSGLPKHQQQDADVAPTITHGGHLFSFIHLGIYKSLTWYNDLIKRKQSTQRTTFPPWPPLSGKAQIYEVWAQGTSVLVPVYCLGPSVNRKGDPFLASTTDNVI